jgi:hypothetical protein
MDSRSEKTLENHWKTLVFKVFFIYMKADSSAHGLNKITKKHDSIIKSPIGVIIKAGLRFYSKCTCLPFY